jgi:glutamate racemase
MSIGLIDSGIGGLTTLSRCKKVFPEKDYIYIADTFYAPYGNKDRNFLIRRTTQLVERLAELGAEAVVLACNSCSSATLGAKFCLPVVRVLPQLTQALSQFEGKILLLATPVTTNSQYVSAINSPRLTKLADCCLATFVESSAPHFQSVKPYLQELLLPFGDYQALIPGCTHYVYLEQIIKEILPEITIFDCLDCVTNALMELKTQSGEAQTKIIVTGDSKNDYHMILSQLTANN